MIQEKNKKTLSPKLDVVFQALFGEVGNERITKAFLQEILKEKIDKIELNVNPILRRETIAILITNEKIEKFEELKYHTEWKISEKENKKVILTDKLEIHIIQLEKIEERNQESNDKLLDWLYFLINPDSRRVKEKMVENEELKEAKEKLDKITEDARMQQLAWWREKAIYEENTMLSSSYRKGKKEGKKEAAKKMKEEKIPIDAIIRIAELTKEEIEKL